MAFLFHARAQLTTISGRAWGCLHHLRHVTLLAGIVQEGGGGNLTSVGSLLCDSGALRRPEMHRRPWHGLVRSDLQRMRGRCTRPRAVPPPWAPKRNPFRYELLFHFSISLLFLLIALAFYWHDIYQEFKYCTILIQIWNQEWLPV
jgi:hypothetical protein